MYAQIIDGITNIIEVEPEMVQPLRDNGLTIIDITSLDPQPKTGWEYDYDTGEFIPPETPETPVVNYLYIHLEMTDGDGREPIGIKNDGVDGLSVVATFRQSEDPESSVLTSVTGMSWRVTIRDISNQVYDIVDVTFTNGVSSFVYTTSDKPAICYIREYDLEKVTFGDTEYTLKLVGDTTFKVYRQL